MVNRLKKKLHKLKDPQLEFPFNGIGVKPQYGVKIFGTKENNLLFYVDDKGSRSQAYSRAAVLIDGELRFPHYGDYYCWYPNCLLYTSPSPRDRSLSRMPSSA